MFVSRTTIHKDLVSLAPSFESYKIRLNRKNNNGVSVKGSEKNHRKMLVDLMIIIREMKLNTAIITS